ncbi:Protein CYP-33C9 [Aphelenchoides avenae]|nr:Protein CYP-33C9 [Aphelenchus avenae]
MILSLLVVFVSAFVFYHFYWKRRNLPPGPTPLPLIGNLLTIQFKHPPGYDAFIKWSKQYGPVYTYWVGETPVIAITDYDLIQETIVKDGDAYAGRNFFNATFELFRGGRYGVTHTEGDLWRDQRRFALHVLRNLGMGRNLMEERILEECQALVSAIDEEIDNRVKEHDIFPHLNLAAGSIINQTLFGYRFSGASLKEFYELRELMNEQLGAFAAPAAQMVLMMPSMRHFPYFSKIFSKFCSNFDRLRNFFRRQIADHVKRIELEGRSALDREPTDYVEAYLKEMERRKGQPEEGFYTMTQLENGTTSTTLAFAVLYLLLDLDVQCKMQSELDKIAGEERMVTTGDRSSLPYTCAVVNEIQRLCNLVPQSILRRTLQEVELGGVKIAAGTTVVPQISCLLYNEKVFPEPLLFKPERWLDENGQLKKIDEFIPFSAGKRQCLGESLARMELFLFVANLFHQFKFRPVDPLNPPSSKKLRGLAVRVHPFKCRILRRHE